MTETSKTPITVLGGWLGAGKTTMVNRLLRATNERLAIIVNQGIWSTLHKLHQGQ